MKRKDFYNHVSCLAETELSSKRELLADDPTDKLEVVVAEGEMLQEAQNMIAREYSLFMSAKERDFATAFTDLFSDEPDEKINTFVAVDNNSLVSSTGNILATIRIAFGDTAKQPPLEALELIDVIHRNGGHGWPHEEKGVPINRVCEVGRLSFAPEVKKADLQKIVFPSLMKATFRYARSKGAELMFAIMPRRVSEFAFSNGVKITGLNDDKGLLYRDTEKAKKIRKRYPIYWENMQPTLYEIDMYSYEKD